MGTTLLFLGEIQRQCNFALIAYDAMLTSVKMMRPGDNKELDHFWYSVQSFLVAVANISKILWPSAPCGSEMPAEMDARGAKLRTLISIDEPSVLKSREFRNHFEHYDFRIEEWAKRTTDFTIVDSNVVPSYLIAGYSKKSKMRNFDPNTFVLSFGDRSYKFLAVVEAVRNLLEKLKVQHLTHISVYLRKPY